MITVLVIMILSLKLLTPMKSLICLQIEVLLTIFPMLLSLGSMGLRYGYASPTFPTHLYSFKIKILLFLYNFFSNFTLILLVGARIIWPVVKVIYEILGEKFS